MNAKKISIAIFLVILIIGIELAVTGLNIRSDVYITDNVQASDNTITFDTGIASSMGYTRGFSDEGGNGKPHYLKFYSAWGGFNSSLGAESTHTLTLSPDDTEIYVYYGQSGYELALKKDTATGEWHRV